MPDEHDEQPYSGEPEEAHAEADDDDRSVEDAQAPSVPVAVRNA